MNYKSIFNVVGVVAVAAVFSIGCSDKSDGGPDDPIIPPDSTITPPDTTRPPQVNGVVGDWLFFSGDDDYDAWMKSVASLKSNGQFVLREFQHIGNFWIEELSQIAWRTSGDKFYWIADAGSEWEEEIEFTYRVSGDTLKFKFDDEWISTAVMVNLETFKQTLGQVKSMDTALAKMDWYRNGDEHIQFQHWYFEDYDGIYISGTSQSYDNWYWYTEDTRLYLLGANCDGQYDNCTVVQTVTLDYQLTNGNKTLRLRPIGSSTWDEWTRYSDDDYMYKSKAKSPKGKYAIIPFFKDFRR